MKRAGTMGSLPRLAGLGALQTLLVFRAIVASIPAGEYVSTARDAPGYAAVTAVALLGVGLAVITAVFRREFVRRLSVGRLRVEAVVMLGLLATDAIADGRTSDMLGYPVALDAYALGTIAIVAYARGLGAGLRLAFLSTLIVMASGVGRFGVASTTALLVFQRSSWWFLTALAANHVGSVVGQSTETEGMVAAERERRARSADLHDRALQVFVMVHSGRYASWDDVRKRALDEIERLEEAPIPELALSPSTSDLTTALTDVVEEQRNASRLDVELRADATTTPLPAATVAAFKLAANEALTNVRKHAPGARAMVTARARADRITVTIADDGPGIGERNSSSSGGGYGLPNVIEAGMRDVGGQARILTSPDGTTVALTWEARSVSGEGTQAPEMPPAARMPFLARWRLLVAILGWRVLGTSVAVGTSWALSPVPTRFVPLAVALGGVSIVTIGILTTLGVRRSERWPHMSRATALDVCLTAGLWLANAFILPERQLLCCWHDVFAAYGSFSAVLYPFLIGRRGWVTATVLVAALGFVAPLLNGYPLTTFVALRAFVRLGWTIAAVYIVVKVAEHTLYALDAGRRLGAERARTAYVELIARRMLPPLRVVSNAVAPTPAVMAESARAVVWARNLLQGSGNGAGGSLAGKLQALLERHASATGGNPLQLLPPLSTEPAAAVGDALAAAVDVALVGHPDANTHPALVSLTAAHGKPTVIIVRPTGSGLPPATLDTINALMRDIHGGARSMAEPDGGSRLELWAPSAL